MITASREFKEKLKKGANLVNYADITLSDGTVLNLTYKDFMIGGCQIEDKTTDGKFGVGFCIGKTLSIRLENNDERFSKYDFYMSTINLYIGMLLDDGTVEKIRKGVYYTIVPETPGNIIEISAVDSMHLLDKDYSSSTTAYPATLQRIISDACLDCGIPIGFRQFDNMDFVVSIRPEKTTYRQILSYACQIAGYNARIDNNGYMQLIWYNSALLDGYNYNGGGFKQYPHDTIIDGGDFKDYSASTIISGGTFADEAPEHIFRIKSLNVSTDDVQITGVRVVGDDEKTALFGEEGYLIELSGNPFVNGKEEQIATYLGTRMIGMVFRPFSAEILGNPLYEPFEVVRVSDKKGNAYLSIINSVSYKIGGYTQVACEAEDPVRNGSSYASPSAQAVVEARRNVDKQISSYDKAVQNMNQLAANAMGLYRESEAQPDGSYIYYQSNKPITVDEDGKCHFEDDSVVYKNGAEGFFVSEDGGKSFTSGFDAQGNAVVNVLSAIGINADWVNVQDLVAFNATIAGWRIQPSQMVKAIDLYPYMTPDGLKNVGENDPVQYWVWMRVPTEATTPVFFIGYKRKSDYLNNVNSVYPIFSARANGVVTANSFNSSNANITGGRIAILASSGSVIDISNGSGTTASIIPTSFSIKNSSGNVYIGANSFLISSIFYVNSSDLEYYGDRALFDCPIVSTVAKSRVIDTDDFGKVLQYCYETPSPMFGDIGSGKLDEDGLCYIYFDPVFSETVSTSCSYYVFLQKEGQGDIWVKEKTKEYFIVEGTPSLAFSWEAKERQRDYEYQRLEVFDTSEDEPEADYESLAITYLNQYEKEIYDYEEAN